MPRNVLPEIAVDRAQLLIGCYRNADFGDPEIAMRAFVSVLARYPEDVVIKVTEPATGIPSKLKWPPSIAEVVDACNEAMAPILREFDRKMVAHRQARLLAAPLPGGPKMSLAEMEAKVGRPLLGWVKRMDDPDRRSKDIEELHRRREAILEEASRRREKGLEAYREETKSGEHYDDTDFLPEPPETKHA